jgi:hypothetical protein
VQGKPPFTSSNLTDIESKHSVVNKANTQSSDSRAFSPRANIALITNSKSSNGNGAANGKLYYSQLYGKQEQGLTVYYNELSPGQIHRKPIEQLEYENGVLLQQLQERDEVIAMFKAGWTP